MHAGAVLFEDRLGQESGALACGAGDVLDDVLVRHQRVGHAQERLEAQVDLALAGAADLVVVELARHAEGLERHHHQGAQVAERVQRRRREVTLLRAGMMADVGVGGVAHAEAGAAVPVRLGRVDLVEGAVRALVE